MPVHVTTRYQGSPDGGIPPSMSDMGDPFIGLARASAVTTTSSWGRESAWFRSTIRCCWPRRSPPWTTFPTADFCSASVRGGYEKRRRSWGAISASMGSNQGSGASDEGSGPKTKRSFTGNSTIFRRSVRPPPSRKPHPPIFLGGSAKNVFKRVVAWGDGWMPTRATPEDIKMPGPPWVSSPLPPDVIPIPSRSRSTVSERP